MTVVSDQAGQTLLHMSDDRGQDSLPGFYEMLSEDQKAGIENVPIEMWPAYIWATLDEIPAAQE